MKMHSNLDGRATEYALWISNDLGFGEYLNGEIVGDWGDRQCVDFCQEYIDDVFALKGNEFTKDEQQMIDELNLEIPEVAV